MMFDGHIKPRPAQESQEMTAEEKWAMAELDKAAADGPAAKAVQVFTEGIRTGSYQLRPRGEEPSVCARTSALGLLVRTATEIGRGKHPEAQQAMLVLDPPDGPGADQIMKVADVELTGVPKEFTTAALLGLATNWGLSLWTSLRVVVLAPIRLHKSGQNISGSMSTLYAYRDVDDTIKVGEIFLKMEKTAGKWIAYDAEEIVPKEGTWTQILRAMFAVNRAIAPIHAKIRLRDNES